MNREALRAKVVHDISLWDSSLGKGQALHEYPAFVSPADLSLDPDQQWFVGEADVQAALVPVDDLIGDSQAILAIPDDWDHDGGVGYAEATLRRATNLARTFCWLSIERYLRKLPPPDISAADSGSVDVFWQRGDRYLLMNIPSSGGDPYTFFGEGAQGETISGSSTKIREDLLVWLLGE